MFRDPKNRVEWIRQDNSRLSESKNDSDTSKIYQCEWCDDGYLSETEVAIHMKKKHHRLFTRLLSSDINMNNMCRVCMSQQDTPKDLINHLKKWHLHTSAESRRIDRPVFICDACNKVFFSKSVLACHLNLVHPSRLMNSRNQKIKGECPICNRIVGPLTLKVHLEMHRLDSVCTCPICYQKEKNVNCLRRHIRRAHPPMLMCDNCNFETLKVEYFSIHIKSCQKILKTKKPKEKAVNKCFVPSNFIPKSRKYKLPNMVNGIDVGGVLSICILCREMCTDEESKLNHIANYHDSTTTTLKPKPMNVCECGEIFLNTILLKQHLFKTKCDRKLGDETEEIKPKVCILSNIQIEPASSDLKSSVVEDYESGEIKEEQEVVIVICDENGEVVKQESFASIDEAAIKTEEVNDDSFVESSNLMELGVNINEQDVSDDVEKTEVMEPKLEIKEENVDEVQLTTEHAAGLATVNLKIGRHTSLITNL